MESIYFHVVGKYNLLGSGGSSLTLLDDDLGHLITLPLATEVGAEALLQELEGTLILRDTQQFHGTTLVGGETDDLSHDTSDELVVLGDCLWVKGRRGAN